jgi:hypothetical protein
LKRLLETEPGDRGTERAKELLALLPATDTSAARRARVRIALDERWKASQRGSWWFLRERPRYVQAALVVLLAGASAVAARTELTALWGQHAAERAAAPTSLVRPSLGGSREIAPEKPNSTEPSPAPVSSVAKLSAAPPVMAPAAQPKRPQRPQPRVHDAETERERAQVALVHEAAAALRRDGDPARAQALLEKAGATQSGPLEEEAFALKIEASLARLDGKAPRLGAEYLRRYPKGRYVELARRALRATGPR